MSIYIELLLVAAIVVFVVDLSGFTDTWRGALQRWLRVKALGPVKPFDCSLCMTWWTCLAYALATGHFTLPVVAYSAALAFSSVTISDLLIFINETINALINYVSDKIAGGRR